MATIIICDFCGSRDRAAQYSLRATVPAGIHPHDNKELRRDVDICLPCLGRLQPVPLDIEFEQMQAVLDATDESEEAPILDGPDTA
jgi:hypothetical protein